MRISFAFFPRASVRWIGLLAWVPTLWLPAQAERPTLQSSSTKRRQFVPVPTPRPSSTNELEAYINLHNLNLADGNRFDAPSQGLAFALRKYPDIWRFRVAWSLQSTRTKIHSTLLYDRRASTVTFYSSGEIFGARVRDHWRDRGVSDALLFRLADQTCRFAGVGAALWLVVGARRRGLSRRALPALRCPSGPLVFPVSSVAPFVAGAHVGAGARCVVVSRLRAVGVAVVFARSGHARAGGFPFLTVPLL